MSDILIGCCIVAGVVFACLLMTSTGRAALFMLTRPRLFQIWLLIRKRKAGLPKVKYVDFGDMLYCQHCETIKRSVQCEFSKSFVCLHCGRTIDLERFYK